MGYNIVVIDNAVRERDVITPCGSAMWFCARARAPECKSKCKLVARARTDRIEPVTWNNSWGVASTWIRQDLHTLGRHWYYTVITE